MAKRCTKLAADAYGWWRWRRLPAAEDDGWVLSYVCDGTRNTSELIILDASDVAAAPVAAITLPPRIPFGFHRSWISDARLGHR
jgi:carotenoid cleavage dioxygenase-like enzyme